MAFFDPKSSSYPESSTSRIEDHPQQQHHHAAETTDDAVTSFLYLKPAAEEDRGLRRSLDKDLVLRRIRHRKRTNQIREAVQSTLLLVSDRVARRERGFAWMEDDAFSSP